MQTVNIVEISNAVIDESLTKQITAQPYKRYIERGAVVVLFDSIDGCYKLFCKGMVATLYGVNDQQTAFNISPLLAQAIRDNQTSFDWQ